MRVIITTKKNIAIVFLLYIVVMRIITTIPMSSTIVFTVVITSTLACITLILVPQHQMQA